MIWTVRWPGCGTPEPFDDRDTAERTAIYAAAKHGSATVEKDGVVVFSVKMERSNP